MGVAGTTILHPSNAPIVNRAFSPGPEQLAQYRAMIAEYERAQAAGLGTIMVGGEHIAKAHVATARPILTAAAPTDTGTCGRRCWNVRPAPITKERQGAG